MVVQIPAEIESQFVAFAHSAGESTDDLVCKALCSYLDDMQDVAAAKEHLLHPNDTITLDELKKNLGLDD
jgi:hypothetical protein